MDAGMAREFADLLEDFAAWLADWELLNPDADQPATLVQEFLAHKNAAEERSSVR